MHVTGTASRRPPRAGGLATARAPDVGWGRVPSARRAGRRLLAPVLLGAAGAAAVALVAVVDPERPGHYPVCPTYALTGLYCPGCGGLRAVHAVAHGDLGLALQRNPLVVVALPLAIWAYLAWVRGLALGRPLRWLPPRALTWGAALLVAVWAVLRNVPACAVLAP